MINEYMNIVKEDRWLFRLYTIFMLALGSFIGLLFLYSITNIKTLSEVKSNDCKGLSLIESSYCLRNQLLDFYHYNISNVGKKLTLDELKIQGGVCSHYSEWYESIMKELGFNTQTVIMKMENLSYHKITVSSDRSGYCIMDQTRINCIGVEQ